MDTTRFEEEEFSGFVQELIYARNFNDAKETGIAKLVVDKGYGLLTEKQRYIFDNAILPFYSEDCEVCNTEIPWSEMSMAEINGHICGYCQHKHDKIMDE